MERPLVVVTVPHAVCPADASYGHCDVAAGAAAALLTRRLDRGGRVDPSLLLPDTDRSVCDLNRPSCRSTRYRRRVDRHLASPRAALALDVHSFPPDQPFVPGTDDEIVLLDDLSGPDDFRPQSVSLLESLTDHGIRARLLRGEDNDILLRAVTFFGVPAVLVEFNDRLLQRPRRLRFIVDVLGAWVEQETK